MTQSQDITTADHQTVIQFRLNRGTAKKWRQALLDTDWVFDPTQLSFMFDGRVYGSPEGILARIVEPEPKFAWDGASHLYDKAQFYITHGMALSLKLKGTLPEFSSFADAIHAIDEMATHHGIEITEGDLKP